MSVYPWNNEARANIAIWTPALRYSVDFRIQNKRRLRTELTEPVPLKHGELATKYLWIYVYVIQLSRVV